MGDDGGQTERLEEEVKMTYRQPHDLDRAAQSLHKSVHAVFQDEVDSVGIDLAIGSPSDSTFRLSESVTEAHGSANLRRWLKSMSASVCLVLLCGRKHSTTL